MDDCKLPYEKPELWYWRASDLDAIEASMSGHQGGGYTPPSPSNPYNYANSPEDVAIDWIWVSVKTNNPYWFGVNDSGVHDLEIYVGSKASAVVYKCSPANGRESVFDGEISAGTKSLTASNNYYGTLLICVKSSSVVTIKCRARRHKYLIPSAKVGSCGVVWRPKNTLYRPDHGNVCYRRWYIKKDYVADVLEMFKTDEWAAILTAAASGSGAVAKRIKKVPKLAGYAAILASVICDIADLISSANAKVVHDNIYRLAHTNDNGNQVSGVNCGVLFTISQSVSGDATVSNPEFGFVRWTDNAAYGESAYDDGLIETL